MAHRPVDRRQFWVGLGMIFIFLNVNIFQKWLCARIGIWNKCLPTPPAVVLETKSIISILSTSPKTTKPLSHPREYIEKLVYRGNFM